jgi:hypothetical protein
MSQDDEVSDIRNYSYMPPPLRTRRVSRRVIRVKPISALRRRLMRLEAEDRELLSDLVRNDLRHLMTHGHCRLGVTKRLYQAFLDAHGGKMPDKFIDTGRRRRNKSTGEVEVVWEAAPPAIDMLDLTQWLNTQEGHIATRKERQTLIRLAYLELKNRRKVK